MHLLLYILGILGIVYGLIVLFTWSGTLFFAVWFVIGAVLAILGWLLQSGTWEHIPALFKRVAGAVLALIVVVLVITQACVISGFGAQPDEEADYLIVLGAQVRDTGPSVVLAYRLDAAYDYLIEHPQTQCIVSGGKGGNEHAPEADVMAAYLTARGIDPERILIENTSRNTVENIRNSMAFIDPQRDRVAIVTNNFHIFRGVGIARKMGIVNVGGLAAGSKPLYLPNNMLYETFGITKDFLTGNL